MKDYSKMDLPLSCNTKPFKATGSPRRRKCSGDLTPSTSSSSSSKRSSIYKGVTRHRLTGRYEAHIWDKSYWNKSQNRNGRQVYLGAYNNEETAARNYDLAALKYWGIETMLNFPAASYAAEYKEMQGMSKEDYLALLRRRSSGFTRGASKYRGVARHHYNGRWEARIGRINGNKYLYLGTFSSEEEAAQAYDRAALIYRGPRAMTNFDLNQYAKIQTQKTQLLSLQQEPPCCQQQHHQDITHPIMLSEPTSSFSGAMAMMEDIEEFSWSSIMNSSFETFSVPDLIIDMNIPDDIDELINNIEWLADESGISFFEANGEEVGQRSMTTTAIDSSNSHQIISTSLIGGQQLVEEEEMC